MTKKYKFIAIYFFFNLIFFNLNGQSCNPDLTIRTPGFFPNTLDSGMENKNYSKTIQFYSIRDTSVPNPFGGGTIPATIDTIVITKITNMPPGLTYVCNPPNCKFLTLTTNCINIYGKPNANTAKNYDLSIAITVKATVGGALKRSQDEVYRGFNIFVKNDTSSNSNQIDARINPNLIVIYPNPSEGQLQITNPYQQLFNLQISNLEGKIVYAQNNISNLNNEITLNKMPEGIYTANLFFANGIFFTKTIYIK